MDIKLSGLIAISIATFSLGAATSYVVINATSNVQTTNISTTEIVEPKLEVPTAEEAITAFRDRPGLKYTKTENDNDTLTLGECYQGTQMQLECGADVIFKNNGVAVKRIVGFTKTPTGWLAKLL